MFSQEKKIVPPMFHVQDTWCVITILHQLLEATELQAHVKTVTTAQPCRSIPSPWERVNLPGGTTWVPQQGSISSWYNNLNSNTDFPPVFYPSSVSPSQGREFPFLSLIFSSSFSFLDTNSSTSMNPKHPSFWLFPCRWRDSDVYYLVSH